MTLFLPGRSHPVRVAPGVFQAPGANFVCPPRPRHLGTFETGEGVYAELLLFGVGLGIRLRGSNRPATAGS